MNLLQHAATIDKVKVGDWVFSLFGGWDRITRIADGDNLYPIATTRNAYDGYGKQNTGDKYPRIFLIDPFNGTKPPEPEIDWEKVPRNTYVECTDFTESKQWESDILIAYVPGIKQPFVTLNDIQEICTFQFCRLSPGVEVKPEWLKT